jgi:hypothetical protein
MLERAMSLTLAGWTPTPEQEPGVRAVLALLGFPVPPEGPVELGDWDTWISLDHSEGKVALDGLCSPTQLAALLAVLALRSGRAVDLPPGWDTTLQHIAHVARHV